MNTEQSTDVEREHEEGPPRGVQTMAVLRWLLVALMAAAATAAFGHEAGWSRARLGALSTTARCTRASCWTTPDSARSAA
jgi:hypothetical protein